MPLTADYGQESNLLVQTKHSLPALCLEATVPVSRSYENAFLDHEEPPFCKASTVQNICQTSPMGAYSSHRRNVLCTFGQLIGLILGL
ncbi:hypothetical protein PILCRDRAFT_811529 [Piloderma croceum F 1598]|uniref:Uncharacterized protein n=1 Tax=Piloderma croceum (strain F 1598) TaxID=765440 RepID=A0A0C3GK58_PILCF|nr:hypothetical protein PILCRDRAFT_811529 [Piloderma croceum F 1598]